LGHRAAGRVGGASKMAGGRPFGRHRVGAAVGETSPGPG
jgi:hypothetical protein